jgi:hypothetical protein
MRNLLNSLLSTRLCILVLFFAVPLWRRATAQLSFLYDRPSVGLPHIVAVRGELLLCFHKLLASFLVDILALLAYLLLFCCAYLRLTLCRIKSTSTTRKEP